MYSPTVVCGIQYYTMKAKNKMNKSTKVAAPVAVATITRPKRPVFGTRSGLVNIRHKEFAGSMSVVANNGFTLLGQSQFTPGYDINPACNVLFPWLSGIAKLYEKYRFNALRFYLISSVPTTTAGKVYLAVDYDYDDDVALTKVNLLTNHTVVQTSAWNDCEVTVDTKLMNQNMDWRYTLNPSNKPGALEPRTSYGGFLMVACDQVNSASAWDLWVEYDVDFSIERLDENLQAVCASDTAAPPATNVSGAVTTPWSVAPLYVPESIRIVKRGEAGFPALSPSYSGVQWLLDIGSIGLSTVTLIGRLRNGAGLAANTLIDDVTSKFLTTFTTTGAIAGSYNLITGSVGQVIGTMGKDSADPTLAGSYARLTAVVNVPALLANMPNARFVTLAADILTAAYFVDLYQTQIYADYK